MFRMRIAIVIVLVAVMVLVVGKRMVRADDSKMPQAGQMAPNFTLNSQEDKPVSLDQYKGKWVVLYFYPKDQTSGCTIEAHNFQRDLAQYTKDNAVILGVSVQDPSSHRAFCAKESLTFKLLADTDKKVSKLYDSVIPVIGLSSRHTFLIDPSGKIVRVWTDVDVSKHSEEVLAELAKDKK